LTETRKLVVMLMNPLFKIKGTMLLELLEYFTFYMHSHFVERKSAERERERASAISVYFWSATPIYFETCTWKVGKMYERERRLYTFIN